MLLRNSSYWLAHRSILSSYSIPLQDLLLDRSQFRQGHPSAASRSVWLKSLPTNSSGTFNRSARA